MGPPPGVMMGARKKGVERGTKLSILQQNPEAVLEQMAGG